MWWHRLLLFLKIRNEFDWAFPAWPEVNHPYMPHASLRCCEHCGGGRLNWIHRAPYDVRRTAEILQLSPALLKDGHALAGFERNYPVTLREISRVRRLPGGYIEREH